MAGMTVTLLGTGTPWPDLRRQGPAVTIQIGDDHLLFDTGRGVVTQLLRAGIPLRSLKRVFLTHHHFDHIGDLFDVILSTWIDGRKGPLQIFGPTGTTGIINALVNHVYAKDIEFRTREYAPIPDAPLDGSDIARLEVQEVGAGLVFETDHWQVQAEFVQHPYGAETPRFEWVCLGYRVTTETATVAISGDSVSCTGLDRLASGADLLIQCCVCALKDTESPMLDHLTRYVLPSSHEVGEIAARANVGKLVLTHIGVQGSEEAMEHDVRQNFQGELIVGEDLLQIQV
jgi:ribonuclease Z